MRRFGQRLLRCRYALLVQIARARICRTRKPELIVVNMHDFEQAARAALAHATQLAGLPAGPWATVRIGERGVFRRTRRTRGRFVARAGPARNLARMRQFLCEAVFNWARLSAALIRLRRPTGR
jgi:hypothetical protein